jgi:hypothetical protein
MRIPADISRGIFYSLNEGYVLLNRDMKQGMKLVVGAELSIKCMFQIRNLLFEDVRVGFIFTSGFEITNRGGYLLTFLKGKSPAEEYDVLLKDDFIVLYDYPNRGTLAISPLVSDEVLTIFQEQ